LVVEVNSACFGPAKPMIGFRPADLDCIADDAKCADLCREGIGNSTSLSLSVSGRRHSEDSILLSELPVAKALIDQLLDTNAGAGRQAASR
jgi:hypothetical protein